MLVILPDSLQYLLIQENNEYFNFYLNVPLWSFMAMTPDCCKESKQVCVLRCLWGPFEAGTSLCEDPECVKCYLGRILKLSSNFEQFNLYLKIFNFGVALCSGGVHEYP